MLKIKTAIALQYDKRMNAPEVSIQLKGVHAEEFIKRSSSLGVPIIQNSDLTEKLKLVPETHQIPEKLYSEVAELFISLGKI